MLTDRQIVTLRADKRYRALLRVGLKRLGSDIIASGDGEFRADASYGMKFLYTLTKSRIIRSELASCADGFLQKFVGVELQWPRTPASVKSLCDHDAQRFVWVRYDEPRVRALFQHCEHVFTDPGFRELVKELSTIPADKNARLRILVDELHKFERDTIRSIRARGLFDGMITMQKDEYYEAHERDIQDKFLNASKGGALGLPPGPPEEQKND